jgi:uncharacterized protein (TIRG00374 family)
VNNVLPARLGEFARAGMLAQTSGLPFVQSLTVTLLERVLDGLCLLLLLVVAGRMVPDVGLVHNMLRVGGLVFGIAAFGVLFAVAAPSALLNLTSRITHRFGARLYGVGIKLVSQLVAGVSYIRTLSSALSVMALSVLVWLCEAGMFYALMPAFGIPASPWFALLAMCVTNLGILVPSTPGFIGAFHAFCMMAVMLAGVSEPVAFSYAALVHLSFYVPITLWGFAIAFTYGLSFGEMANRAAEARPIEAGAEPLVSLRGARAPEAARPARFWIALVEGEGRHGVRPDRARRSPGPARLAARDRHHGLSRDHRARQAAHRGGARAPGAPRLGRALGVRLVRARAAAVSRRAQHRAARLLRSPAGARGARPGEAGRARRHSEQTHSWRSLTRRS